MLSVRYAAMAMGFMFIFLAFNASAQWSPGGAMVYMGDLNLAASPALSGKSLQALDGSQEIQLPANNSSLNNSSINSTTKDNFASVSSAAVQPSADTTESSGKPVIDLSGYARDRANKNLAGYKNIMYPISGSRGSTTSTAGGSGGCGCG